MQYVGVELGNKVYTYEWDGEVPMRIGDRVVIPPNYLSDYPSFANVVELYSSREQVKFKGKLARLMGKVNEDA